MEISKKKIIAGTVAGVVLAAGVVYAVWPEGLDTVEVTRQDVTSQIKSTGTVAADDEVIVYAPVSGKLTAADYTTGDTVEAEDILSQYDLTEIKNAYDKAVLNEKYYTDGYDAAAAENKKAKEKISSASAGVEDLKNQYAQTKTEMDTMDTAQAGKVQYIGKTLQEIETAIADKETALSSHQVNAQAVDTELVALEAQLDVLNSQSAEYEKQIAALGESSDPSAADTIASLQAEKGLVDAQIEPAKAKIQSLQERKQAENREIEKLQDKISDERKKMDDLPVEGMTEAEAAQYAALATRLDSIDRSWEQQQNEKSIAQEKLLNDSLVSQYEDSAQIAKLERESAEREYTMAQTGVQAGCSGVILEKYVQAGAMVEAGQELYAIQPTSGYKVSVMISKYDMDQIALDQSATVTLGKKTYDATVNKIYPVAETDASGKPKVKVDVVLEDMEEAPVIGLEAEVTIHTGSSEQVLAVPVEAVFSDDEGDYVYVDDHGSAKRRNVICGNRGFDQVEIKEGLEENEKVVITPAE